MPLPTGRGTLMKKNMGSFIWRKMLKRFLVADINNSKIGHNSPLIIEMGSFCFTTHHKGYKVNHKGHKVYYM